MLDAIALYLEYRSSCIISLRIVMTDLDLLSCTSRKDKADRDLIKKHCTSLKQHCSLCKSWTIKCKRFRLIDCEKNQTSECEKFRMIKRDFDLLSCHAVSCAILESIDGLFSLYEFVLWLVNQIIVWTDDFFLCVDEVTKESWFWSARAQKISVFDFWLATQLSIKLLSQIRACFDRTNVFK